MPKILSQSGISLADTYDIEGSIVGVENLNSNDVNLFDEMGGRVFAERLQSFLVQLSVSGIAQSTNFSATAGGIPDSPNRLLGIYVFQQGTTEEVDNVQCGWNDTEGSQDFPLWVWNTAVDSSRVIRFEDGGAVGNDTMLVPALAPMLPTLLTRTNAGRLMPELVMRGTTAAFGAGTVAVKAVFHLARANPGAPVPGDPSSHGLPLPSW